jgi:hypothetical protein
VPARGGRRPRCASIRSPRQERYSSGTPVATRLVVESDTERATWTGAHLFATPTTGAVGRSMLVRKCQMDTIQRMDYNAGTPARVKALRGRLRPHRQSGVEAYAFTFS